MRVRALEENLVIEGNTNAAFAMAGGDYIGLLDHDDLLAPDALYEIAAALDREKKKTGSMPEFLYTDEDKVESDLSRHFQPNLKPDFSPDLLRSNNYICHFVVFAKSLYERLGSGLNSGYEGAQDYDFVLRCTEEARGICHVPRILYHWRVSAQSTADNPISKEYAYEAGARAIEAHLARVGLVGEVSRKKDFGCYRVRYPVQKQSAEASHRRGSEAGSTQEGDDLTRDGRDATQGGNNATQDACDAAWDGRDVLYVSAPLVSVIIPNKDEKETLEKCLHSIFEKTTWKNFEIIIVENNSETQEILNYYQEIDGRNGIHVVYWNGSA
ncbi:MAG: glycosyltransferase, partial [Lachnospiraceae bacterium]|nr:glycosyltransferase [Lachnospiraceae bacterium]